MERIKQAIEKARAERRAAAGIGLRSFRLPDFPEPGVEFEEIRYTHTRVVKLDGRHLEENRIVAHNKADPRATAFDILRTKLLNTMGANGWQTLAITSPNAGCGKTTIAINLAISVARQPDYTVLLADFDVRQPALRTYLGLPREDALTDCIEGRRTIGDALINPGIPRLVILANSTGNTHAAEFLSGKRVKDLIAELRQRYERRILIFDMPPLLTSDDAMALLPQIDCVVLVAGSGSSTKSEVEECQRVMVSSNFLGVVLNKADDFQLSGSRHVRR